LWAEFGKRRDEMDECYEKAADGKRHICKFCTGQAHIISFFSGKFN
jgi:hypothetical protein